MNGVLGHFYALSRLNWAGSSWVALKGDLRDDMLSWEMTLSDIKPGDCISLPQGLVLVTGEALYCVNPNPPPMNRWNFNFTDFEFSWKPVIHEI